MGSALALRLGSRGRLPHREPCFSSTDSPVPAFSFIIIPHLRPCAPSAPAPLPQAGSGSSSGRGSRRGAQAPPPSPGGPGGQAGVDGGAAG